MIFKIFLHILSYITCKTFDFLIKVSKTSEQLVQFFASRAVLSFITCKTFDFIIKVSKTNEELLQFFASRAVPVFQAQQPEVRIGTFCFYFVSLYLFMKYVFFCTFLYTIFFVFRWKRISI